MKTVFVPIEIGDCNDCPHLHNRRDDYGHVLLYVCKKTGRTLAEAGQGKKVARFEIPVLDIPSDCPLG